MYFEGFDFLDPHYPLLYPKYPLLRTIRALLQGNGGSWFRTRFKVGEFKWYGNFEALIGLGL